MPAKTCIFVDGENFRHSIGDLFPEFRRDEYLPKSADWGALFDWIVSKAVRDGERLRTYWYVIQSMDFFPYRFPDPDSQPDELRRLLSQKPSFKTELDQLDDANRRLRMTQTVKELRDRQSRLTARFNGWTTIQDGIAARHTAVEFRRAGAIRCNLFDESFGPEKAVDVKLASDLIILKDIYDVAIILSGDQDYVPAVQAVKDFGKRVVNVAFLTRGGQLLPGGARRLNQITDWSLSITHADLGSYLFSKTAQRGET